MSITPDPVRPEDFAPEEPERPRHSGLVVGLTALACLAVAAVALVLAVDSDGGGDDVPSPCDSAIAQFEEFRDHELPTLEGGDAITEMAREVRHVEQVCGTDTGDGER